MFVPAPPAGVLLAATQDEPFQVCQVAIAFQLPLVALRKSPLAALTRIEGLVPVFPVPSVAVTVMVSAILSSVLMVNVPFDNTCMLSPFSPKMLLVLLSNCALTELLLMVTTVELSGTVLLTASWAVTVTPKATPCVCGVAAVTT